MASPTSIELMDLLQGYFSGPSWNAWRVALKATDGLPMSDEEEAVFYRHTGRRIPPTTHASEVLWLVGRRGGKDRILTLKIVQAACFRTYRLAPGERGVVAIVAADREQAKVTFRYLTAYFDAIPTLAAMIIRRTADTIELKNSIIIEVRTGSYRTIRGRTVVCFIGNEIAYWPQDTSANPASEILNAIRPAMLTIPNAQRLLATTPHARKDLAYETFRQHWGKDDASTLIWVADSRSMNPTLNAAMIEAEFERDAAVAMAEYGRDGRVEFRADVETFVTREAGEACVVAGCRELPPAPSTFAYVAFTDPSGGSQDSMTLAVAHREDARAVLDLVREVRPPFSPEQVVGDFCALLRTYHVAEVIGDKYAGEWPREQFRKQGIPYRIAERTKSEIYRDLLPLINSRRVALLDEPRLLTQLLGLERTTARGGRDSIDHGPGARDDVINSAAGALVAVSAEPRELEIHAVGEGLSPHGEEPESEIATEDDLADDAAPAQVEE